MAGPRDLIDAARAAHVAGDYRRAVALGRQVLAEAAGSDAPSRARAALQVAKSSWNMDDVATSAVMLEAAVAACGDEPALREVLAEALALQGACFGRQEQPVAAVQALREAVALLAPQMAADVRRAVYVGVGLGYQCLWLAGKAAQAFKQALDLVRADGEPALQLRAAMNLCFAVEEAAWQQQQFNPGGARRLLDETLALQPWMAATAAAIGTRHAEMEYLDAISRVWMVGGHHDHAKQALARLLEVGADAAGDLRCDWHLALASIAHAHDDREGFARHLIEARNAAGDAYSQPRSGADIRRAAQLLAYEGKALEALDLAWRYHARALANETAALEARLAEMSTTLAHQTLQLQVADLRAENAGLVESGRQLVQLSRIDPLTGALNRRGLEAEFARLAARATATCLLLIDLDRFKQINDTHGHAVGDQVLKGFVKIVSAALRDADVMGRLGGEEFVVLFGGTGAASAAAVAARLLDLVRQRRWERTAPGLAVSFSGGLVQVRPGEPFNLAVERADVLLYQAKHSGRARIEAELPA